MSKRDLQDVFVPTALRFCGFDLGLALLVVLVWVVLDVADPWILLGLSLVRIAIWAVHLHHLLAPARDFAPERSADVELETADLALHELPRRFMLGYAGAWCAMLIASVALSHLVLGDPLSAAELMTGALTVIALMVALSVGIGTMLRGLLHDTHARIGATMQARKLAPRRARASLGRAAGALGLVTTISSLMGLGGVVGFVRVQGIREASVVEQQRRAELSAVRVITGYGPALDGVEVVPGSALPELLRAELDRSTAESEPVRAYDRARSRAFAAAPLGDGRWVLAAAETDEQLGWLLVVVLGFTAMSALPSMIVGQSHGRALTSPIAQISRATQRLVEGGSLAELPRVVSLRNDEVGVLALSFNELLDMLEELAVAAGAVAKGDLRVELDHPGELQDAFRGMLGRLHEMVVGIRETALELASAAAEIHAITQQQEQAADRQTEGVQEVSAMVTSLAEAAEAITTAAQDVRGNAEQTLQTTDAMAERIDELSRQAGSIAELLEVIREVADRSDLLALNGSLEATRAGEAGRGFGLVAAEMRRLAERVTGTVSDVREQVAQIRASGSSTVLATEESRKLARSTVEAAQAISAVTRRQSEDTEQAATNVHEVAQMVVAAAAAASQTRAASEGLRAQAAELERLIGQFELHAPPTGNREKA